MDGERASSGSGDLPPLEELYDELHRLAEAQFRGQPAGHTLQPTVVLHEAWMRLSDRPELGLRDREHFLSLAARVMRLVLIDHARSRNRLKRGGAERRVTLIESLHGEEAEEIDVVDLSDALDALAELEPERARLVELRFFGGLGEVEVARVMGVSRSDVQRKWRVARAWLASRLRGDTES